MIFSLFTPAVSGAQVNAAPHTSLVDSKEIVQAKMGKDLQKQFEKDEKVTFLIKFKDKADPMKIAKDSIAKTQGASLSAFNKELVQRSAIISELKATAIQSQQNVASFLEAESAKGNASDIKEYFIVNGMAVTATKEVAEKIATFPEVEKILPNEKRQLFKGVAVQESPKAGTQSIEWNVDRLNAPDVWGLGIDGSGVVVANIDTGVEWDHPALKEKYRGYDAATGEVDHTYSFFDPVNGQTEPYDHDGHGSHTMGTMVGGEPNGSNQIGIAPGAKWIAVQAFTADGAYDSDLLEAAEWIMAPGGDASKAPDVVNNSWGGGSGIDEWYRDVVIAWRAANIFPAFAAGNTTLFNPGGPGSVASPSNYPESFAVGATDSNDMVASFSLRGPSPYGEIKPEVAAPGVSIRSSLPGGGYGLASGTSMATPAVAGVIALLKSANSSLTVDEIEQLLMDTATPRTDSEYPESPNNGYGHGLVDAFAAVSTIADGLGSIEGQVMKDGDDNEAPVVEHNGPSEAYAGLDLELEVSVSDDVSVTSVQLQYGSKRVDATRKSGNFQSGTYSVIIPGDQLQEGTFTYNWIVKDFGNNQVVSDLYNVEIKPGITNGYTEDFETNPVGWNITGTNSNWAWGVPTSGPNSATSGENVYATNLAGDYSSRMDETLVMPPVQVASEGESFLQFKSWHNFEQSSTGRAWDYGKVVVSTDLENWTELQMFQGESSGWEDAEVDLTEYAGQTVYLGFYAYSDGSITRPGWYIDDVALSNTSLNLPEKIRNQLGIIGGIIPDKEKEEKELAEKEAAEKEAAEKEKADDVKATPEKDNGVSLNPSGNKLNGLPLSATVSVLESGRSVSTNPQDGSFSMMHPAGTFTMVAETYGFRAQEQSVTVEQDGVATANFMLEELPKSTLTGTLTNQKSGEPIEGASLLLVEDANVEPVSTDANGNFSITAYEGTYTLKVIARDFIGQEIEVTFDEDKAIDIALEPFFTVPGGEIGYDDGTAENARAFYDAGNGWAVKMSLPEGKEQAIVTEGVFQFHGTDWPSPGATNFAVEVWSAGEDGLPAEKLAGPIEAEAIRDLNQWTVVDLSEHNIQVNGDFFMVYVQTGANPNVPGLATDENGENAGRSYQVVDGAWSPSPAAEGNYMIRARVAYGVGNTVITSPTDGTVTNEATVTVEGTASPTTSVTVLNNGDEIGSVEVTDDGTFQLDVELQEGENTLTAVTYVDGEEANESEAVTVTLDTTAPELSITNVQDGDKTNRETLTVEGTVNDENLASVTVNGQKATVNNGTFSKRILLDEGENTIEVIATDEAGNAVNQSLTVFADFNAPVIENVTPAEDKNLKPGDTIKITFDSESGLDASFVVHMPLTNLPQSNPTELPLHETSDGHYVGYWTVPSGLKANGAVIEVIAVDDFGNETRSKAAGKLYISDGSQGDSGKGNNGKGNDKGNNGKGNKGGNGKAIGKN
ncbi:S8 family peptidase [Ornithinibacillus scapharcae]|uniref:S8 family serine peptidase n=1 Tax=Ornithinibacillus scapharcae TaxID=1147159 RepID=UPI000680C082|nr:S8 family peptidase [Ornithinibacillus scapharcae]